MLSVRPSSRNAEGKERNRQGKDRQGNDHIVLYPIAKGTTERSTRETQTTCRGGGDRPPRVDGRRPGVCRVAHVELLLRRGI